MKDSSQVAPGPGVCNFERIAIQFLDISHIVTYACNHVHGHAKEFDMSVTPKYHELNS